MLFLDLGKAFEEQSGGQATNTSLDAVKGSLLSSAENLLSTVSDTLTSCALSENGTDFYKFTLPPHLVCRDRLACLMLRFPGKFEYVSSNSNQLLFKFSLVS